MDVKKFIPKAATRKVARTTLKLKHNSPHIFFAAGVVGMVGSTVLACRATLKLGEALDEIKDDVETVKALAGPVPDNSVEADHSYQPQYYRDMAYVYAKGTLNMAKLYGPSVVVGGISIAALTGSHVSLTRRNTALTAAYAGLSSAYEAYRLRVAEEIGVDKELDIYRNVTGTATVTGDDGKPEKLKEIGDPNKFSPHARIFDEASPRWRKNGELNRLFVQCQQNYANQKLQTQGYLFLNDVYEMLGIPRSQAGQVVGWAISDDGDNYVDFNMFEAKNARFLEGWERSIVLDFNINGVIQDKI